MEQLATRIGRDSGALVFIPCRTKPNTRKATCSTASAALMDQQGHGIDQTTPCMRTGIPLSLIGVSDGNVGRTKGAVPNSHHEAFDDLNQPLLSAMLKRTRPFRAPRHQQALALLTAVGGLMVGLCAGSASAQHSEQGAKKAMFKTKAEAEAAAKSFNCQGAHKMGNQWMPCASHGEASGSQSTTSAH
ncbi:hypothetical protein [Vulcanococcus limneticus]|uniref:hypothetical protein n=1 Tax=Vulcanococcus limneticus TaxID=2170428 RepID=UPI00398BC0EB